MFFRILAWEPGAAESTATPIKIYSGTVAQEHTEISRSFHYTLPRNVELVPNDFGSDGVYQSGAFYQVETSLNGSFAAGDKKIWFYGTLLSNDHERTANVRGENNSPATGEFKAYDPLKKALSVGVNISWATKMKIYEDTFTDAEFDPAKPFFIVNLPDNGEDWVPEGIIAISARKTTGGSTDESGLVDYDKSEYYYSAGTKQIFFHRSQEFPRGPDDTTPQADFEWTFRILYYDPADTLHTVTNCLTAMFRGDPNSDDGGLGFAGGDIDLDEIYGFDGVTPKKIRTFVWDKSNGPVNSAIDKLRDLGLIPNNYVILFDPTTRKITGRHFEQDDGSAVTMAGVLSESTPFTIEDAALRVECWSEAIVPQDSALGLTVTLNTPAGYTNMPASGADTKITDGDGGTSVQYQKALTTLNYPAVATDGDAIVVDLGSVRRIGSINFRGATPKEEDGPDLIKIPVYFESRQPKLSISVTDDPTDVVGVPINPDAIAFLYSPREPDDYADGDFEAKLIQAGRYVLLRWDQDYFFRRDGNNIGAVARMSCYPVSEIRVMGDGRYRYDDDHPEAGALPNARITNKGDTLTAFSLVGKTITVQASEAAKFVPGELIMLWDTSGLTPFTSGPWTISTILGGVITVLEALPGALAIGDKMGPLKRWMELLTGGFQDLKAPKLYQKLINTTARVELLTDSPATSIEEAEQLALERLLELNKIDRDYEASIALVHTIDMGTTVRARLGAQAWIALKFQLDLKNGTEPDPPIEISLGGNDYENEMS